MDKRYKIHVYFVAVFMCKVYCNTRKLWRIKKFTL